MKKYFPAGADGTVWIVTSSLVAMALLLLALAGGITSMPSAAVIALYIAAGVIGLILLIGWLAKPTRYEIRDESVSIVRSWPFRRITIRRSEIKEVRHVRLESVMPASAAVAWVFGYAGLFQTKDLGAFLLFATSPRDVVLIRTNQSYVISPANPKRFMQDLSGKR
ncbi:MAG TPA: PH domain-containing protein [Armatimonadota bacterium]|nr:PH domain-containing protein [Armatimonadota bacterium]